MDNDGLPIVGPNVDFTQVLLLWHLRFIYTVDLALPAP